MISLGGSSVYVPKRARPQFPHAFRLNLAVSRGEKHKYILSGESAAESQDWQHAIMRFSSVRSNRASSHVQAREAARQGLVLLRVVGVELEEQ